MNHWDVLGIEPTNDCSLIRKAYAHKLKEFHPELDPSGYQTLREAYDRVFRLANETIFKEEYLRKSKLDNANVESGCDTSFEDAECAVPQNDNVSLNELRNILKQICDIYDDFQMRIQRQKWDALLESAAFLPLDIYGQLFFELTLLTKTRRFFPREIWKVLDRMACWTQRKKELYMICEKNHADYILSQISPGLPFLYDNFDLPKSVSIDDYLKIREDAIFAIRDRSLIAAAKLLREAEASAPADINLVYIRCELYILQNLYVSTFNEFEKLTTMDPNNVDWHIWIAESLYGQKYYSKAVSICNEIRQSKPGEIRAIRISAECNRKTGYLKRATEDCIIALNIAPRERETRKVCNGVIKALQHKMMINPWFVGHSEYLKSLCLESGLPFDLKKYGKKKLLFHSIWRFAALLLSFWGLLSATMYLWATEPYSIWMFLMAQVMGLYIGLVFELYVRRNLDVQLTARRSKK